MRKRFTEAPDLQYGAFLDGHLVGFICATRASGDTLTHASMSEHVPEGTSVCIHSVCVDASQRRKGVALTMLKNYLTKVIPVLHPAATRVLLISKQYLLPLYQKAGLVVKGKSAVVHGADPWYECEMMVA